MSKLDRRNFLKKTSLTAAALATATAFDSCAEQEQERPTGSQYMGDFAAPKLETVKIALIGVGARGSGHSRDFASLEGTEIVAISDLYEDWAQRSADRCKEVGEGRHQNIKLYYGDENKWKQMLTETKPDAVIISTNWANHAPMAIEAMKQGAHAFVEVPLATTLDEMWAIVDTSEATGKHCMMMENVNYGRDELMFLNMCRQGLIGDLLHGEASYIHELRFQMEEQERGTGSWRTHHYANRNGNLYPTHGLGPVAQYMNLARTDDTFGTLVSYSTPAMGRAKYAKENYAEDHKWNQLDYKGGDLNTSIIKTQLGRTVMVQWDETSPRPYSRLNLIQGTTGCLAGFPTRVALEGGVEGFTDNHHSWAQGQEALAALYERYDHPLYKKLNESTKNSGHGGMDGIMRYRIVESLRTGTPLDQNLYEGCFWSAVGPLSEKSVAEGGMPQAFPDFTRGGWKETKELRIIS
ncbi:MAG: Gfo/Idh/MocA family oxidoreductase [Roseivirga sp.]|uniref:Gfo/Idh/MocA family protein n=1 Tax=Roseivirga sp. TaxID=1964215 RepID=UPI001B0E3B7B|nr:Gfo/Idh/MocA family oxidoreductase [Roseivirga sp.]MBO6662769.1 Gfo/Idh/MocA family oxidoreductase [Roseivirga sp.]MBO6762387.1 Gfo/Idh/MocA family oxidoreductase [Roseivirga sp.]MBO6909853.1 Gfo/Idh/MocA family oxidoreductase [Roseivirga sp.]